MKFKDVPIWQRFKLRFQLIKVDENVIENGDIVNAIGQGTTCFIPPETEVELITKCENCKHYSNYGETKICEMFGRPTHQDTQTFSCSLFEQKED